MGTERCSSQRAHTLHKIAQTRSPLPRAFAAQLESFERRVLCLQSTAEAVRLLYIVAPPLHTSCRLLSDYLVFWVPTLYTQRPIRPCYSFAEIISEAHNADETAWRWMAASKRVMRGVGDTMRTRERNPSRATVSGANAKEALAIRACNAPPECEEKAKERFRSTNFSRNLPSSFSRPIEPRPVHFFFFTPRPKLWMPVAKKKRRVKTRIQERGTNRNREHQGRYNVVSDHAPYV